MTITNILVHIDNNEANNKCLRAAIMLAEQHSASLTGLYVISDMTMPYYGEMPIPLELLQAQQQEAEALAAQVKAKFEAAVTDSTINSQWQSVTGAAEYRIAEYARFTDLVILRQGLDEDYLSENSGLAARVVLRCTRPVLLIPDAGFAKPIGQRVLVAWNRNREAVRAVNDALPLLQRAATVEVLAIAPDRQEGDLPTADICLHLARHGVNAEGEHIIADDMTAGETILTRAQTMNMDLIIMGGYGRSRLREVVFGGATRYLLKNMTVPVLMSH